MYKNVIKVLKYTAWL